MTGRAIFVVEQQLRDCEARLRAIFDSTHDGMFMLDSGGCCIDVNPAGCAMTGRTRAEIIASGGQPFTLVEEQVSIPLTGGDLPAVYRLESADGRTLWVEHASLPVMLARSQFTLEVLHDITRSVRAEQSLAEAISALREHEERYLLAASGAHGGLWDWDLKTGKIFFSQRFRAILGCGEEEIGDSPEDWFQRIHPDDLLRLKADLSDHISGHNPSFENENRILHHDGRYLWVVARGQALRGQDGLAYRLAGSLTDITACKRARMQIDHDALHDSLTGLPNRALFVDRLQHALHRCLRRKEPAACFAVLHLDLDRFRFINTSLGHAAGDEILVSVAHLLRECLRDVDTVARLSGDEFGVLLEDVTDAASARMVADRILEGMRARFLVAGGSQVFVSASIGMVLCGADYDSPSAVLRDVDIAKYRAKSLGSGRCVLFDPQMHRHVVARLELENELRLAVEREEFRLHFQPILSLASGDVAGFEALLRWMHPRLGLLAPLDFLAIAEETGLIVQIGRWVLENACRQLAIWHAAIPSAAGLTISVNISSTQIHQPGLVDQVDEILLSTGLDPAYLQLEITEATLLEDSHSTREVIQALRARGIRLHIDDFGTGYSALSYLKNFPVDMVKIDRSFIEAIGEPGSDLEVIRSILKLAGSLGLQTVAEGIETAEQLREVMALPCPYGQGYFISRPLDAQGIEEFLANRAAGEQG